MCSRIFQLDKIPSLWVFIRKADELVTMDLPTAKLGVGSDISIAFFFYFLIINGSFDVFYGILNSA